jgi:EAL domain-containing protein (putative c-di-GMP-specific phosphodiesterase class I)
MLRKADIALYEAKSQGRARYRLFVGDMDDVVRQRRAIERDLRAALSGGRQIGAVYQPLFANGGTKIVGAEALARWDHPVHGTLSPQLFIGIAEERGLIEQLGEHILRQACAFAAKADLPWVAVNVSPIQFRNDRLVERVMAILQETGLPPDRLQLEITEGVLIENQEMANRTIAAFRAQGVRIALDDFGTGYSSMSYLRRYGVDKLKIDRSFIRELGVSADADAIVRAMVSLGRALHMQVTAEGVETVDQRDHLTAIGCHELQGFLLSRPLAGEQLIELLGGQRETGRRTAG